MNELNSWPNESCFFIGSWLNLSLLNPELTEADNLGSSPSLHFGFISQFIKNVFVWEKMTLAYDLKWFRNQQSLQIYFFLMHAVLHVIFLMIFRHFQFYGMKQIYRKFSVSVSILISSLTLLTVQSLTLNVMWLLEILENLIENKYKTNLDGVRSLLQEPTSLNELSFSSFSGYIFSIDPYYFWRNWVNQTWSPRAKCWGNGFWWLIERPWQCFTKTFFLFRYKKRNYLISE